MTVFLLIVLLVMELGFMIFELSGKSSKKTWTVKRIIINAAELAVFVMMALLPGIDFSFRFKGLMAILALRIVVSAIFLAANRKNDKDKKKVPIVLSALLSICMIATSLFPAFLFYDYQGLPLTGTYQVSQADAIMVDTSRIEQFEDDGSYREVPIYLFYPEGTDAKMPLIIFSHGAFGYYQSNESMYRELASHGFVVASIEHPYHSIFTHDTTGKTIIADGKFLNDAMTSGSSDVSEAEVYEITSEWMALRLSDMNFAIDSLKAGNIDTWYISEDQKDGVAKAVNMIDTAKIGLMGHSMGGATAVTCGRRDDISAVVDLDGTMIGENIGCNGDEVLINEEPYHTPLLNFQSQVHHEEAVEADKIGYRYSNNVILKNADEAFSTYFVNSDHMNFTDLPLFSPTLAKMLGTGTVDSREMILSLNSIVLDFFECYLKGEGNFEIKEFY